MSELWASNSRLDQQGVVAYGFSTADALVMAETARHSQVRFCRSVSAMANAVREDGVIGAAMAVNLDSVSELRTVVDALGRRHVPIPLLIRFDLSMSTVRQVLDCCDLVYDLRLSLRAFDPIRRCVASLTSSMDEHAARRLIVSKAAPVVPSSVREIALAAIILGERRSTVRELADICGCSRRTLEERLAAVGMPPAKWLLMQALVLHSHWRISQLGWTPGRAAARAGFRSVDLLSRRVERATGARLSHLKENVSFGEEIERFAGSLRSGLATAGV